MASPCAEEPAVCDRLAELKPTSDEAMAGLKSPLVDQVSAADPAAPLKVPVVDLSGAVAGGERRREAAEQLRGASESWGIFYVVGHGLPRHLLDELPAAARRFHEGDDSEKAAFSSPDMTRKVQYTDIFNPNQTRPDPNWRNSLFCSMAPVPPQPGELPATCREAILEYSRHMERLGETLFELLAESLGLRPCHFKEMECDSGRFLTLHYYPTCADPDLTLGCVSHSDASFVSVLLQDDVGGLQALHQGRWVDVPPTPGALVVNLGDLMQLITNDRFKGAEHRVLGNKNSARVSVGYFFTTVFSPSSTRLYGPTKELLSEGETPKYRELLVSDYTRQYRTSVPAGIPTLSHFTL